MEHTNSDILMIGGADIDYLASPNKELIYHDSNPGAINKELGGVMRNLAENVKRLGCTPFLVTPLGKDGDGERIAANLKQLDIPFISPKSDYPTAIYLEINNYGNDMEVAIIDDRIYSSLNIEYFESIADIIDKFEYILIDSDLTPETLKWFCEKYKDKKIMVEAISANKVVRFQGLLKYFYLISCNYLEAKTLTRFYGTSKEVCEKMLGEGAKNVVITDGANDIVYGNATGIGYVKTIEEKHIINTTGCGDALYSGVIASLLKGRNLQEGVELGEKLADLILSHLGACSPEVSRYRLK
jgi:pseudouridine kinase